MSESPKQTVYELIGGESGVRGLADRFYDEMERNPDFAGIRAMHPPSLANAREKLFWFLSGWMGGPELYTERVGPPHLRIRHQTFQIGESERDQWLACMSIALQDAGLDVVLKKRMMQALSQIAERIRNRP